MAITGTKITIDSVTKTFNPGEPNSFRALQEVSIDAQPGEFVSIVGPSGCGKSTLMLMAAGLLQPTMGKILMNDQQLTGPLTDVGVVFQDDLLLPFRHAEQNIHLQGEVRRMDMAKVKERTNELIDQLDLGNAVGKFPRQLSGGMRQRVAIARALVHDPSALFMDEPFGALDALTRLQVRRDLEELWMRTRPTVLFITHSIEEAVGLADRVLVFSGSPGEILDEIIVDLPRPRPLALGEAPELSAHARRIYDTFERVGVLTDHGSRRGA